MASPFASSASLPHYAPADTGYGNNIRLLGEEPDLPKSGLTKLGDGRADLRRMPAAFGLRGVRRRFPSGDALRQTLVLGQRQPHTNIGAEH
jgi:hypothetical protein